MKRALPTLLVLLALAGCGHATPALSPSFQAGHAGALADDTFPSRFAEVVNTHKDKLFRGGLPDDAQLKLFFEQGLDSKQYPGEKVKISTIVNLLSMSNDSAAIEHEAAAAKAAHVKFVNIQLPWGKPDPTDMVQTFFQAVEDARANHTGVYVHCTHGRDRTGSMVAAYRIQYDHYSNDQALTEMEGDPFDYDPKPYPWYTTFVETFKPLR